MSLKHTLPLCLFTLASLFSCGKTEAKTKTITIDGTSYTVEAEELVIGMECNYSPFNWTTTKESEYTLPLTKSEFADGYDIQIAKILSEKMSMDVKIVKEQWESLIEDCNIGNTNLIIAGMTDTEERRQSISFSDEYYRSEVVLLVKKEIADQYQDKVLTNEDLKELLAGKQVISQKDTVEDDIIDTFVKEYGSIHVAGQTTYGLAAKDVEQGLAFALTVELPVANAYVATMSNVGILHVDQSILGVDLAELGVSIGIKKGNDGLKAAVNHVLSTITADERTRMMNEAVERSAE